MGSIAVPQMQSGNHLDIFYSSALEHVLPFGYIVCFTRNLRPPKIFGSEKNKDLGEVSAFIDTFPD